jgi:RNA polymerase sigma-70 factor (ECF subfamily)
MAPPSLSHLSDDELFAQMMAERAAGRDFGELLGVLCSRWQSACRHLVRRIQSSYRQGSSEDEHEVFNEAVERFMSRGLSQFRGASEQIPGKNATPKAYFLRIAKHLAIDRYRRSREVLHEEREDEEGEPMEPAAERRRAVEISKAAAARNESVELYWKAFARLEREHPNEAAAWALYHHEDVEDHAECARRLSITVVNSYKRVSRAQAHLRLYLLELEEEGA